MKKEDIEVGVMVKKGGSTVPFKDRGHGMIKAVRNEASHYYCLIRWEQSAMEEWVHANRLIRA